MSAGHRQLQRHGFPSRPKHELQRRHQRHDQPRHNRLHQVTITATNGTNSDSATFFWQVGQLALTNPGAQLNMTGDAVSLTMSAHETGCPTFTYTATGLPRRPID